MTGVDKAGELNFKQKKNVHGSKQQYLQGYLLFGTQANWRHYLGERIRCGRRDFYLILETLGSQWDNAVFQLSFVNTLLRKGGILTIVAIEMRWRKELYNSLFCRIHPIYHYGICPSSVKWPSISKKECSVF